MRSLAIAGYGLLGLVAMQGAAWAADPYGTLQSPAARYRPFELRLGVYAHDPVSPEKGTADLNGEVLFDAFGPRDRSRFGGVLVPRLHAGATINMGGRTSQGYAGLTWTWDVTPRVFLEAGFGGAFHNGNTQLIAPAARNAMGCNWGFHEQGTLGYRISDSWSVMLTVEHTSNSGICKQNRGLTNVGMRVGYSF
jgi:lipid A 3-O-deacylase